MQTRGHSVRVQSSATTTILWVAMSLLVVASVGFGDPALAQEEVSVRVATYNIKFLSVENLDRDNQAGREEKIEEVIELLDADVVGLQEIDDRAALERIFSTNEWLLIIDDNSGVNQDVAVAVRKPFGALGFDDNNLSAEDDDFLFSDASNTFFPRRRDVLAVEITIPGVADTFTVMVVHTKSRFERDSNRGRATNDFRREGASRLLVQTLEQEFQEQDFILLGDFNDNPDDRSINILEAGDPDAIGGPEEDVGPFLINLTESLVVEGHVSHGRNSLDVQNNGRIETIDPDSRDRNNDGRGTNLNTGDILFDQLLIPMEMQSHYVADSAQVFDLAVAVEGNSNNRASDHLPVFADFVYGGEEEPVSGVRIVALLPDPSGADAGNETVTLRIDSGVESLDDWMLIDRAGNQFALSGTIASGNDLIITLPARRLPLNNTGDTIVLLDGDTTVHEVTYAESDVVRGVEVSFE